MVNLPWGSPESTSFVTSVGLVTSKGKNGDNIMAAEWTHHISYSPALIAVSVGHGKMTGENIAHDKIFGVSIASQDQNVLASTTGNYHGHAVDKFAALQELGFRFIRGKETGVYLVDGAVLQLECKLVNTVPAGDHTLYIGEVVSVKYAPEKDSIAYHKGKFWKLSEQVHKPAQTELDKIKKVFEKHARN